MVLAGLRSATALNCIKVALEQSQPAAAREGIPVAEMVAELTLIAGRIEGYDTRVEADVGTHAKLRGNQQQGGVTQADERQARQKVLMVCVLFCLLIPNNLITPTRVFLHQLLIF